MVSVSVAAFSQDRCTHSVHRSGLPNDIEALFKKDTIKDVDCVAFGEQEGSHVCAYTRKIGPKIKSYCSYGHRLPKVLLNWLQDSDARDYTSMTVILGPGRSFFAWDTKTIRWSQLPEGLELTIQRWLSPNGWKVGAPRIIALGCDGAYFALSENGEMVFYEPGSWPKLRKAMDKLDEVTKVDWKDVKARYPIIYLVYVDKWEASVS